MTKQQIDTLFKIMLTSSQYSPADRAVFIKTWYPAICEDFARSYIKKKYSRYKGDDQFLEDVFEPIIEGQISKALQDKLQFKGRSAYSTYLCGAIKLRILKLVETRQNEARRNRRFDVTFESDKRTYGRVNLPVQELHSILLEALDSCRTVLDQREQDFVTLVCEKGLSPTAAGKTLGLPAPLYSWNNIMKKLQKAGQRHSLEDLYAQYREAAE